MTRSAGRRLGSSLPSRSFTPAERKNAPKGRPRREAAMTPYRLIARAASAHPRRMPSGFCFAALLLTALALAPVAADGRAQARLAGPDIASGLSVQFTDNFLKQEGWRGRLDLISALGATVVRIDLNWPWVEPNAGSYDWSLYDQYAAELAK